MRRAALVAVLAAAACGGPAAHTPPSITVTIPRGATFDVALDSLTARGVITHPLLFGVYARVRGLRRALKSGTYAFRPDESWSVVAAALERGRGALVRWTIPEGLMASEVAAYADTDLGVRPDSFRAALRDPDLLAALDLPAEAHTAEGFLFPTTYFLPHGVTAREVVRIMTREFLTQWDPAWDAALDSLGLTRYQAVTLASIVESEVRYDPDRPFVAAVYLNRLRRGMKLEADPTVIYALGRRVKRVYEKELRIRSPYNTYLHAGLPPGPISQPGRASLDAVAHPAHVPFLYFVAQPDGKHIFSVTFAQHEAAIRQVHRLRDAARAPRPPRR